MTPAELRALPIVIHERRHHRHLSDPAFNDLLVRLLHSSCSGVSNTECVYRPTVTVMDCPRSLLQGLPCLVIHVAPAPPP